MSLNREIRFIVAYCLSCARDPSTIIGGGSRFRSVARSVAKQRNGARCKAMAVIVIDVSATAAVSLRVRYCLRVGFLTIGFAPPAQALPSFARQTGQPCGTCHTDFPALTPYGRRFKLLGYTTGGGEFRTTPFSSKPAKDARAEYDKMLGYVKTLTGDLSTKPRGDKD